MAEKTIYFNQEHDVESRKKGMMLHDVAKTVRNAGFPLVTMSGVLKSEASISVRKQFKLSRSNAYSLLEFASTGTEEDQLITDWLNSNTKTKVINSGSYEYSDGTKVFRIIVDINHMA